MCEDVNNHDGKETATGVY